MRRKETFLPVGTTPGTLVRLIMNYAFIILLTHRGTVWLQQGATSVVLAILSFFSYSEQTGFFSRDRSNERKKNRNEGVASLQGQFH